MSDKRTLILEAAIELFAANGFWNTPTSKISKHAGVSTGTLFNYFASKDALIDEVYLVLRKEQSQAMRDDYPVDGTVRERFEHLWFRYIMWGLENDVRYQLLRQMKLQDLMSPEAQERSTSEMEFAAQLIIDTQQAATFGEMDHEFMQALLLAQLEAAVMFAKQKTLKDMALTKHITQSFNVFWTGATS